MPLKAGSSTPDLPIVTAPVDRGTAAMLARAKVVELEAELMRAMRERRLDDARTLQASVREATEAAREADRMAIMARAAV